MNLKSSLLGIGSVVGVVTVVACTKIIVNERPESGAPASPSASSDAPAGSALLAAVPLQTKSRWIMDANGRRFKLAGVSWYGGESPDLVPLGLDHNDVHAIAHVTKMLGFNSVRIPWANELYESNPVVADALVAANPALKGKHVLEVLDAVIDAIAEEGMLVILDNHRSRGDWCCDTAHGDGLWHTAQYPESSFVADWLGMVQRYASQPAVVGVDLRNELRAQWPDDAGAGCYDCDNPPDAGCGCLQPSWGDNNALTDWAAASERVGNAILQVDPNLLIIVEGDFYATWFGASYRPVHLAVPNRLVYSPHNYSSSNGGAASFADYDAFKAAIDSAWGYLLTEGQPYTAPVWLGEFGANNTSPDSTPNDTDAAPTAGARWWIWIRQYMTEKDVDWAVWALNGTQGRGYGRTFGAAEGFGVLSVDWNSPAPQPFLTALQALQPATLGP
ncbi:MAG TPA: cellulase family glycosylhydrolase [Polyangiaceae bacterium]|nr:cellulase family glycosylhydrolase [Polyangiaceae bacterium]